MLIALFSIAAADLLGTGPLEELLADCYAFIFVDRLRTLQVQLAIKPNIDGLIFLNIRNFLYERQKDHDPLGYHVFTVVVAAVKKCLANGVLHGSQAIQRSATTR